MREVAEKKKSMEKEHAESVSSLRTAQAQLGLLGNSKNADVERAQHSQNIESLQVRLADSSTFILLRSCKSPYKLARCCRWNNNRPRPLSRNSNWIILASLSISRLWMDQICLIECSNRVEQLDGMQLDVSSTKFFFQFFHIFSYFSAAELPNLWEVEWISRTRAGRCWPITFKGFR